MLRRILPFGVVSRAMLATIAVGALVVLVACGSAVAGGHSRSAAGPDASPSPGGKSPAHVALCTDLSKLTSVAVGPTMTLHAFQPGLVLPRSTAIRQSRLVRGLATALCRLPTMPPGPGNCPAQFGASLRLAFAAGGRTFLPVTVQVSGCRVVQGLGPARTVPSRAVWRILGKDLGLKFPQGMSESGGINP
jgi:hypothetical protein